MRKIFTFLIVLIFLASPSKAYELDTPNNEDSQYKKIVNNYEELLTTNPNERNLRISSSTISTPRKEYVSFEHEKLPNLDGTWFLTKTFIKRLNPNIIIKKPTTFYHCTSKMPIQNLDIVNKKIQVNARGIDFFVFNPKHPNTQDLFHNNINNNDTQYINFGFKGEIDAYDLSYAYTLKTNSHTTDNLTLARQLILNGKVNYKVLSKNLIVAQGYEVQESPECKGFILDEVEIKLVRVDGEESGEGENQGKPLFEQPAYAEDRSSAPGLQFDSAKDKSGFEPIDHYGDRSKKVPGMW